MNTRHRRIVSFGGSAVAIEYSGSRAAAIVDFLYRHVPADSPVPPHATYRLTSGGRSERLALYRDEALIHEGDSRAALAERLLGDTCHHLAQHSQGGLLFHAAGLVWRGHGLLMPGGIGAGKTTLAAWLATQGFDYLTDELVFVPYQADGMRAFTRPLNLKHSSRDALRGYFDFERHAAHIWSSPRADLIPPALLNPTTRVSKPPLSLIIFPRYLPGSDLVLRPLSKAQAGLALMQGLVNARNLPGHGFSEIARLARAAPAYKMRYASFDQIGGQVEALFRFVNGG